MFAVYTVEFRDSRPQKLGFSVGQAENFCGLSVVSGVFEV
jgi:hypothetical protein